MKFSLILLISIFTLVKSRGGQSMLNGVESDHQPFVISVRNRRLDQPFGAGHLCGGSILAHNAILTAASCIRTIIADEVVSTPTNDLIVVANTNMRFRLVNAVQTDVLDIHIHPDYQADDRLNNVAILVINSLPINTRNIEAINVSRDLPIPGTRCQIYGYGQALSLTGPMQKMVGNVQIFDSFSCEETRENMVCAGEDVVPCNGDEGGPLVCDNQLAGIIDFFDIGHCRGVIGRRNTSYIEISAYRRWINEVLSRISSNFNSTEEGATDGVDLATIAVLSLVFNVFVTLVLI